MKKGLLSLSAIALLCLSGLAKAEDATANAGNVAATVPAPSSSKILGGIDLRPSWTAKTAEWHTENQWFAGYQFNNKVALSVVHDFNTNLDGLGAVKGLAPYTYDFYVKTKLSKIYTESASGIVFGYEHRLYLPITDGMRDKGMLFLSRHYLKASKSFGNYTLSVMELPIFHIYNRAGSISASGAAAANPWYENRVYVVNDFQLSEKVSLSIPVFLHTTYYRNFQANAKNNGATSWFLWTYPELTYQINPNVAVAGAYYSDNLILGDMSATSMDSGFENGVFQVSLQATL